MTIQKKAFSATSICSVLFFFLSCSPSGIDGKPKRSYRIVETTDTVMTNENPKDLNSPLVPKLVKFKDTVWTKN
jgi:hypothetical protein